MGYSALDSGLAVSPRGLGSLVAMMMVGVLVNYRRRAHSSGARLCRVRLFDGAAEPHQSRHFNGFGRRAQLLQRICRRVHLCAAHHHDHEHAAQAGDRQRRRHLQPDAQHRRLGRHCHRHHVSGARRAEPTRTIWWPTLRPPIQPPWRRSRDCRQSSLPEEQVHSPPRGRRWARFTAASSNRRLCLPMRIISVCWRISLWSACLCCLLLVRLRHGKANDGRNRQRTSSRTVDRQPVTLQRAAAGR